MPDATAERWSTLLDQLELGVQNVGGTEEAQWSQPAGMGPMPAELRSRAEALVTAQRDLIAALEQEKATIGRHLAALRAVPQQRDETAPIYLDTAG